MIRSYLLTVTIFFITAISLNAQCSRSGSFIAADPNVYPISGDANITFMTNGSKMINFESNFSTVQGLNLQVFLSPTPTYDSLTAVQISTQPLQDDNGGQDTNDPITGAKSFTVPANIELGDYDNILVVCTSISALWGHAPLGQNSGSDCVTLSNEDVININTIQLFPNPATDMLYVKNTSDAALTMEIYSVLGKRMYINPMIDKGNMQLNVSHFNSGIYLVKLSNESRSITQKLIIK